MAGLSVLPSNERRKQVSHEPALQAEQGPCASSFSMRVESRDQTIQQHSLKMDQNLIARAVTGPAFIPHRSQSLLASRLETTSEGSCWSYLPTKSKREVSSSTSVDFPQPCGALIPICREESAPWAEKEKRTLSSSCGPNLAG
jgi:hypothetical protein